MGFKDRLDRAVLEANLADLESPQSFNTAIIPEEEERSVMSRIIDTIRKFLSMDILSLFRMATSGGEVTESTITINDLFSDIICEAVELLVKTTQQGNCLKAVEVHATSGDVTYKGYILTRLDQPDTRIKQFLSDKMKDWKPGIPPPFRWYRSLDDAMRELEVQERSMACSPMKKPSVKQAQTSSAQAPVNANQVGQIAAAMANKMGKSEAASELAKMDHSELLEVAKLGKEATKDESLWSVAKTIFLGYLSLTALVTGAPGLAALVIGYLAVKGIDLWRRRKQDRVPEKVQARSPLRRRHTVPPPTLLTDLPKFK